MKIVDGDSLRWLGRGGVRAAPARDAVWVRVDGVTTKARALKASIGAVLRKDARLRRPDPARGFAVEIVIETPPDGPAHDVDNVAKAVLDALTGAVFRDDSQVARLVVERVAGPRPRILVRARALPTADGG